MTDTQDIVNRLRFMHAAMWSDGRRTVDAEEAFSVMREAADEIERLREQVIELMESTSHDPIGR